MQFYEMKERFFEKLGTHKIMALASSVNDYVTVRNISAIIYDQKIYFKTDKNFKKTKQLLENPRVALCTGGVSLEGMAVNKGLVSDQQETIFADLYHKYWATSYNAYPHKDTEILIEVAPYIAEIWDQNEENHGFQILIDFQKEDGELRMYDE